MPSAARASRASVRLPALAHRAGQGDLPRVGRSERVEVVGQRSRGGSSTERRPPRISTVPRSPRAQRTPSALASVGTMPAGGLDLLAERRGQPPASEQRTRRGRGRRSARPPRPALSSPSQPAPWTPQSTGSSAASSIPAASITASQSGLARPGSSPWARTSPPTSTRTIRSQPRAEAASRRPAARGRGAAADVHQDGLRAEELGHPRLGEAAAERSPRVERRRARSPRSAPGRRGSRRAGGGPGWGSTGQRSQATPPRTNSAPKDCAEAGGGQGADDVAAPAHAEDQRLRGAAEDLLEGVLGTQPVRRAPAQLRRRRAPRSPRWRGRTPRRPSPACPRRADRGRSRPRSGSRGTRRGRGR